MIRPQNQLTSYNAHSWEGLKRQLGKPQSQLGRPGRPHIPKCLGAPFPWRMALVKYSVYRGACYFFVCPPRYWNQGCRWFFNWKILKWCTLCMILEALLVASLSLVWSYSISWNSFYKNPPIQLFFVTKRCIDLDSLKVIHVKFRNNWPRSFTLQTPA